MSNPIDTTADHAHDNGADQDAAPDTTAAETPATDNGPSAAGPPAEPSTAAPKPSDWRKANVLSGPELSRWNRLRREVSLLILAHAVVQRASARAKRLIRKHPCSREEAEKHACLSCGRSVPDWQDCTYCEAEQLIRENALGQAHWVVDDLQTCDHLNYGFTPAVAREIEEFVGRIIKRERKRLRKLAR